MSRRNKVTAKRRTLKFLFNLPQSSSFFEIFTARVIFEKEERKRLDDPKLSRIISTTNETDVLAPFESLTLFEYKDINFAENCGMD